MGRSHRAIILGWRSLYPPQSIPIFGGLIFDRLAFREPVVHASAKRTTGVWRLESPRLVQPEASSRPNSRERSCALASDKLYENQIVASTPYPRQILSTPAACGQDFPRGVLDNAGPELREVHVLGVDPANRPGRGAHNDSMGLDLPVIEFNAAQQRPIRDPRCREDNIA